MAQSETGNLRSSTVFHNLYGYPVNQDLKTDFSWFGTVPSDQTLSLLTVRTESLCLMARTTDKDN